MTQTLTAMYDTHAEAVAAQSELVKLGISAGMIQLISNDQASSTSSTAGHDEGMWGSIKDFFMPEEDRHAYGEGLHRGGTLLKADVEDGHVQAASDILERTGSIDLDEREATWRKEGWDGRATGSTMSAASVAGGTAHETGLHAAGSSETTAARGTAAGTEYIPVVEERLNVGKRMVDSGRVRVRSYAVEKDVSENVTLHDETVQVDRRVVDRAATTGDEALFADKVIEATEMREEAVVSKDARVVGEVGIRKDANQRTETVSDKVRHTEVEVEDGRGTVSRTGTTGTTTDTTDTTPRKPL